ncbi:MAG: ATP-binding protein [Treponema sp.]|jgi:predicted HTH transcriptional regulator|nr:ATP-binding protein [Treponema sp.]
MEAQELLAIIHGGESSIVQFKEQLPHIESIAQEIIAFSNSRGGLMIFGVNDKNGELKGLSFSEIQHINQQVVNAASQKVYPPVYVTTETVSIENNNIVVVSINEGTGKPYKDTNGIIYVKNGADKRKVTSNDELARLLRNRGSLYAEEQLIHGTSIDDIDMEQFKSFILRKYKKSIDDFQTGILKILENLNLSKTNLLTLTGLLLFSYKCHLFRPQFSI